MLKRLFNYALLLSLPFSAFFVGCQKDTSTTSTDVTDYVDETVYRLQGEGNLGRFGCYELVFPVSIQFPDSTVSEVGDYDALIEAVKAWKEANPDVHAMPAFVFPIDLLNEDGEVITVNSKEELKALAMACGGNYFGHHPGHGGQHGSHGHSGNCTPCFEINFPVTVEFPDGTTAEAADQQALKTLAHDWHEANPGVQGRPEIVFPIDVTMTADDSVVTVNSKEELKTLRESCN
ncbi:MAG: hypothetical protein H6562_16585 [Lewinellaceae bacterium]|nr:hypothetical protein [Lewinella sp.]MCB9280512.1 hypothetical protein [Lewinellaceae bacterium]